MKYCSRCVTTKSFDSFYRSRNRKNNCSVYCKQCSNNYIATRYKRNPERARITSKKHRDKNRVRINETARIRSRKPKRRWLHAQHMSKIRGMEWAITLDKFCILINSTCHYCGGNLPETGSALDRKNNFLGYTEDNVVPCCSICNRIKGYYLNYEEMKIVSNALKSYRENHDD